MVEELWVSGLPSDHQGESAGRPLTHSVGRLRKMATGDLQRWFELRDRASSADMTTCTWKIRSAAALCPAYVAASAAGHHGCPRDTFLRTVDLVARHHR